VAVRDLDLPQRLDDPLCIPILPDDTDDGLHVMSPFKYPRMVEQA
jgi:hypothetical protein